MSIWIDKNKCIGCRRCIAVCPGNLIQSDDSRKAYIKYPKDCWGCSSCVKECKSGAIAFYLGADIGGRGSKLTVREEENMIHWYVEKPDGKAAVITVNRKDANKY